MTENTEYTEDQIVLTQDPAAVIVRAEQILVHPVASLLSRLLALEGTTYRNREYLGYATPATQTRANALITPYHAKYFAYELTRLMAQSGQKALIIWRRRNPNEKLDEFFRRQAAG